jgi:hypothetical protein
MTAITAGAITAGAANVGPLILTFSPRTGRRDRTGGAPAFKVLFEPGELD